MERANKFCKKGSNFANISWDKKKKINIFYKHNKNQYAVSLFLIY